MHASAAVISDDGNVSTARKAALKRNPPTSPTGDLLRLYPAVAE
jgi:hypothetical protein